MRSNRTRPRAPVHIRRAFTAPAIGMLVVAAAALCDPAGAAGSAGGNTTGGSATRGRELAFSREANCVLCHMMPERDDGHPSSLRGGTLAPPLAGVGARLSVPQLRARIVDPRRENPETIMPSYARVDGLDRVAEQYAGRPILEKQQIEDIVTWLAKLK